MSLNECEYYCEKDNHDYEDLNLYKSINPYSLESSKTTCETTGRQAMELCGTNEYMRANVGNEGLETTSTNYSETTMTHEQRIKTKKRNRMCFYILLGCLFFSLVGLAAFLSFTFVFAKDIERKVTRIELEASTSNKQRVDTEHKIYNNISLLFKNVSVLTSMLPKTLCTDGDCNTVEEQVQNFHEELQMSRKNMNNVTATTNLDELSTYSSLVGALKADKEKLDRYSAQVVHDITKLYVFNSCSEISQYSTLPFSSGFYWIKSGENKSQVYCSFQSCNGTQGWWRRVAHVDTRDQNPVQCPSGLTVNSEPPSCIRDKTGGGCSSTYFDPGNWSYSYVCGRVHARQSGQPDGFQDFSGPRSKKEVSLEDNYVDGISLTFASVNIRGGGCAVCDRDRPNFIDRDFSCELVELCDQGTVCNYHQLWDGCQCVGGESFYRDLQESTTEQIEMRVCRAQDRNDEDILVTKVELYVQ